MTPQVFPEVLVREIKDAFRAYYLNKDPGIHLFQRALRPADLSRSVSVRSASWRPAALEIGRHEPLENIYGVEVQALVKHADEETGGVEHNILTNELRILAQQPELMTALGQLTSEFHGFIERPMKLRVTSQEFHETEIPGNFIFASFTTIEITTVSER